MTSVSTTPVVYPPEARYREWRETQEGKYVFSLFERFALEKLERQRRFGFRNIAERVRWEIDARWPVDVFKINNNYVPYIGRELVEKYPEMGPYVEFRNAAERRREEVVPSGSVPKDNSEESARRGGGRSEGAHRDNT